MNVSLGQVLSNFSQEIKAKKRNLGGLNNPWEKSSYQAVKKILTEDGNYTRVSNLLVRDPRISLAAKGLYQQLFLKTKVGRVRDLALSLELGKNTVNRYLQELTLYGFLVQQENGEYDFNPDSESWGIEQELVSPRPSPKRGHKLSPKEGQTCPQNGDKLSPKQGQGHRDHLIGKELYKNLNKKPEKPPERPGPLDGPPPGKKKKGNPVNPDQQSMILLGLINGDYEAAQRAADKLCSNFKEEI